MSFVTSIAAACLAAISTIQTETVRVTYYWKTPYSDFYSSKGIGSHGKLEQNGIAANLKQYPIGTTIIFDKNTLNCPLIPITYKVQSNGGSWIINRKAARNSGQTQKEKAANVIDVYVETKKEAERRIKQHPMFLEVKVIKWKRR